MNPISSNEFKQCLGRLLPTKFNETLGIAVSGGVDSMALAILAKGYAAFHEIPLIAFTIDHKSRPESSTEAMHVHKYLTEMSMNI